MRCGTQALGGYVVHRSFGTLLPLAATIAAVAFAAPASATDGITQNAVGTYDYAQGSKVVASWVLTPCGDNTSQCVHVTAFAVKDKEHAKPLWSGDAYWQVGWWTMFADTPNILSCKDGSKHNLPVTYSWDGGTNTGAASYVDPGLCGAKKAKSAAAKITLTKTGPPPAPPAGPQ
jgi:hypothetical protein